MLGTMSIKAVTRDDLESFAAYLDKQADESEIAPKTAINIWGEVTAGFAFATHGKNRNGKEP